MRRLAVALLLASVLTVTPAAAGPSDPRISARPNHDLVGGQQVHVSGRGFAPDRGASVWQCPVDRNTVRDCTRLGEARTGPQGGFGTNVRVDSVLDVRNSGRVVDCRDDGACELLGGFTGRGPRVTTPLHFDPLGPDPPTPTVTVDPTTDLVNGQHVEVHAEHLERERFGYVFAYVCAAPDVGEPLCDYTFDYGHYTGTGPVDFTATAHTVLVTDDGRTHDCRQGGCALHVGNRTSREVVIPLDFDPDGPVRPWPDVVFQPATDLRDGQTVEATLHRVPPMTEFTLVQCPADRADPGACSTKPFRLYQVEEDGGTMVEPITLRVTFDAVDGSSVDCRSEACVAFVDNPDPMADVDVPIAFDPDTPVLSPTIDVQPHGVLPSDATVTLRGEGFVPGPVLVAQCLGRDLSPPYRWGHCGRTTWFRHVGETFERTLTLHRTIRTQAFGPLDCRFRRCHLWVVGNGTQPPLTSERLRF